MERPDIAVHACVTRGRRKSAESSLGDLRRYFDVFTTLAKPGDFGPICKWTTPLPLREHHRAVVILDDDHAYNPASLASAVALAEDTPRASVVQAYGRTLDVFHLPMTNGGPYFAHTMVWEMTPTDIIEAFAGVAMRRDVWEFLHADLRATLASGLSDDERLSDDLVVSRRCARLGISRYAAPLAPPRRLAAARVGAVSRQGDGLAARYKRLLVSDAGNPWWPLRRRSEP